MSEDGIAYIPYRLDDTYSEFNYCPIVNVTRIATRMILLMVVESSKNFVTSF